MLKNIIHNMDTKEYRRIHLAIEGGAKVMHISNKEMYKRLKKQGLIYNLLLRYYDELHTQSKEWLAETTAETQTNWEAAQ